MRKDYTKPLLEIKEYEPRRIIAALEVSETPMNWVDNGATGGYKEFEW